MDQVVGQALATFRQIEDKLGYAAPLRNQRLLGPVTDVA
jgi:hypothetical protein